MEASTASDSILDETDRKWLAGRLSVASDKAFPDDERIGTSAQQDFYFRKLVEVLIENALRYGTPIVGGNYDELSQFTTSKEPEWRKQDGWKRGRSGYDRGSIKTLVHEWKNAFDSRVRAIPLARGRVEFFLDRPGALSDDVVLRAVVNGILPSGRSFEYTARDLTSETRLQNEIVSDAEDESEKKRQRLLREAKKYVRRVENDYLEKLRAAPVTDIEQKVAELRRASRNRRALAAAILFAVGTGMLAYKVFFSKHPIVPIFKMSGKGSGLPSNIDVDSGGRIALKSADGRRATEWANLVVGPDGSAAKVISKSPDGTIKLQVRVPSGGVFGQFEVPRVWSEPTDAVLQRRISCVLGEPEHGSTCFVLLDLRTFRSDATTDTVTIGEQFGDGSDISDAPLSRLNSTRTRIATWFQHAYKTDGTYEMWLVASSDPRLRQFEGKNDAKLQVMPADQRLIHMASVRVEHGEVVHVHADESSPAAPANSTVEIETFK